MEKSFDLRGPRPNQMGSVSGAPRLGVYKPGAYKEKAKAFFRACVGDDTYQQAMSCDTGRAHHYVPARVYLSQSDWEKFCWIEQYGTLDGFPG